MSTSNIYPDRSSLNGSKTIPFPIPVRELQITNTSGSALLKWRFRESQGWAELDPTEIITIMDVSVRNLYLEATNGSYRTLGKG